MSNRDPFLDEYFQAMQSGERDKFKVIDDPVEEKKEVIKERKVPGSPGFTAFDAINAIWPEDEVKPEPPKPSENGYRYYGDSSGCYFCGSPTVGISYHPPVSQIKARGARDDMRAYHVCNKCLGRCYRRATLSHEDLEFYIQHLESRGSVRGRVNPYKKDEDSHHDRVMKQLSKAFNGYQLRIVNRDTNVECVITDIDMINQNGYPQYFIFFKEK